MNTVNHTPGIAGNDRAGWYVQWQNGQGFRSAMPDRETAIMSAGAPVLAEALRAAVVVIETISPGPAQYSGYCKARAALALVE